MVHMFMYQTTHTFITSHQVKEAFPFLTERTKENQQRFTEAPGKIGKVDRQEIYCKLLNKETMANSGSLQSQNLWRTAEY